MTDLPAAKPVNLKSVLSGTSPTVAMADHSEGMSYLQSLPRRLVTLYLPLSIIVVVLLFPFYWMALTAI
jgi:multiple sugar transport system permease protein